MTDGKPPAGRRRSVFPGFADITDQRSAVVARLTALRRAEGRSQAELAQLMGTSQPAVARLESGDADLRLSTLTRYVEALGHELRWDIRPRQEG
jgi:transcriptional regulator with XRE-family HTH domain